METHKEEREQVESGTRARRRHELDSTVLSILHSNYEVAYLVVRSYLVGYLQYLPGNLT